jgi:hypothetical protein
MALGLAAACQIARASMGVRTGLRSAYFASKQPSGSPAFTSVDAEISTSHLLKRWRGTPPSEFSVRWLGFITVLRGGDYTFALTSDDGSSLSIGGRTVVDNAGRHGSETAVGQVRLEAGVHPIRLEYSQHGGEYSLGWTWARSGGRATEVPSWVLSPRRLSAATLVAARALDLAVFGAIGAAVLIALAVLGQVLYRGRERLAADAGSEAPAWGPRMAAATLALFAVLAVAHTWPLASDPGHLSRNDNGDTILNEWIVAWVAHQAPRDPLRLFDANIFHPERHTLAYSESLIVQSLLGAPMLWLGASPVLTYNLLLLAGFALTGWSMCLVVSRWTGDWTAGLISGSLYAFNAHSFTRLPHLQAQHVEFLPLALLALDATLRQPRVRHALQLAGWFTLQALTSVHLLVFTCFSLVAATLARPEAWWGRRLPRAAGRLGLAAAIGGLIVLPTLIPYRQASRDLGAVRSMDVIAAHSATWRDYLSTPARLHYDLWSHRFFGGTALFPGALALVLAAVAVGRGVAFRDPRARMCLAAGAVGVYLSFGSEAPGYELLYRFVPVLQGIRAVVRFGYLGIVAVAVLAGFGAASLLRALAPRARAAGGAALVVIAVLEPTVAPIGLTPFFGVASIYGRVPSDPAGPLVELPFFSNAEASRHARYMLNSTKHWRPILNGYSGFQPRSFHEHRAALGGFPDATSIEALHRLGVAYVFVHTTQFTPSQMEVVRSLATLQRIDQDGTIELYRVIR